MKIVKVSGAEFPMYEKLAFSVIKPQSGQGERCAVLFAMEDNGVRLLLTPAQVRDIQLTLLEEFGMPEPRKQIETSEPGVVIIPPGTSMSN